MIKHKTCGYIGYALGIVSMLMIATGVYYAPIPPNTSIVFAMVICTTALFSLFFLSFSMKEIDLDMKE